MKTRKIPPCPKLPSGFCIFFSAGGRDGGSDGGRRWSGGGDAAGATADGGGHEHRRRTARRRGCDREPPPHRGHIDRALATETKARKESDARMAALVWCVAERAGSAAVEL